MYFSSFPKIYYKHPLEPSPRVLTDIFRRAGFPSTTLENASVFYSYTIRENETPRELADRLYGRQDLDWIIPLFNRHLNPYFDWPMNSRTLEKFIETKYPGISIRLAANQQAVRRKVVYANTTDEVSLEEGVDEILAGDATWADIDDEFKSAIECTFLTQDSWYSYWNDFPVSADDLLATNYAEPFTVPTNLGSVLYTDAFNDALLGMPKVVVGDIITLGTSTLRVTEYKKNLGQLVVELVAGAYPGNSSQYRIIGNPNASRTFESENVNTSLTPPPGLVVDKTFGSNSPPVIQHKYATHHYLGDYAVDAFGETIHPPVQEIVARDTDKTGRTRIGGVEFPLASESITQEGKRPVTNYDYEVAINDAKRIVKIPVPQYVTVLEESLKAALNQ